MKRKFLLLFVPAFILYFSFLINNCKAQWIQRTNGINGTVKALAVSGTNIFAGVYLSGAYMSTDNGVSWTAAGFNGHVISAFAVSGTNLFAGSDYGVYLSTNNGTNWVGVKTGIGHPLNVKALAVSGSNIFAAYSDNDYNVEEVSMSTNNGTNWISVRNGLPGEMVLSLAVMGTDLFAGLNNNLGYGGVYRSTNNGTNWASAGLPNRSIRTLAVSGTNLFAGDNGGVLLSTNNGTEWNWVNNGLTNTNVYSLAVSGTSIYAGTAGGVFLSTNNGTNWVAFNEGFSPVPYVYSLLATSNFIYAGTWAASVWSRGLTAAAQVKVIIEGHYNKANGKLNKRDTLRAYLRNITSPFAIVDSARSVIDSITFTGSFLFSNAPSGTYYIQIKHRNSIETWSKPGGQSYTLGSVMNYDFTSAAAQSYGSNMIQLNLSPPRFGVYSGDVNQNGFIDLTDVILVYNDASAFVSGYVKTDINGDDITDLTDILITYNNSAGFVSVVRP